MAADELASRLGTEAEPFLLDVREPDEVTAWPMPRARNIPLGLLGEHLGDLPVDREIVVLCASGNRSRAASHALARAGFQVANLAGGMAAWGSVYDEAEVKVGSARIIQFRRRGKGCLSYLVGSGDEAFALDVSLDIDRYAQAAAANGWHITRVLDTHLHADHLSGSRLLALRTGASLHLNPADTFDFDYVPLSHEEQLSLPGDTVVSVATLHTPGHTQGSTLFRVDAPGERAALITGDTLFVDGVGRPDLAERAEEFARNLHRSLHQHVLGLPDDTLVLPAHYGSEVQVCPGVPVAASIGELRRSLEPLSLDEDAFVAWAASRVTPRPPNYEDIVTANMGRSPQDALALRHLESGPNRCSA